MIHSKNALFHDGTLDFCHVDKTEDGYIYTFKLRSAVNSAKAAYISIDGTEYEMNKVYSDEIFDEYIYKLKKRDGMIHYHFRTNLGELSLYYDIAGAHFDYSGNYDFVLTVGFESPDWAKGAVMYQIFTDRFCNGDKANDVQTGEYAYVGQQVEQVRDWYSYPESTDIRRFYGGDLQGVWDKLDYLQKLGVDVIYFNPIFVSPSNHKYDTQDYDYIDPHYGVIVKDEGKLLKKGSTDNTEATKYICRTTDIENLEASNKFFADFVKEVHNRGMKVIIDGVFNHCGSFNKWMDKEAFYKTNGTYEPGAFESKDSPYNSFFKFENDKWPNNNSYEGWWGFDTLPKLNYEDSDKLCEYILNIGRKWVSEPYNVDGWRLDVAADLGHSSEFNHQFWKRFRKAVKEANPNAIILAEHYGEATWWLKGDEWDTVMNYDAFMEPVTWFLTGVDKHSDKVDVSMKGNGEAFIGAMTHHMAAFQSQSMLVAMNELSNHDHSRFLTRTNRVAGRTARLGPEAADKDVDLAVMKEAVVMQMTLPGAPTIYYGDEAGVCGWTDPDNRRTYPWGRENFDLLEFHRDMICIHKQNKALKMGAYKPLIWEQDVLAYARFLEDNIVVTVVNNSDEEKTISVPVWQVGVHNYDIMNRIMLTQKVLYNAGSVPTEVADGMMTVSLPPVTAAVYKKK